MSGAALTLITVVLTIGGGAASAAPGQTVPDPETWPIQGETVTLTPSEFTLGDWGSGVQATISGIEIDQSLPHLTYSVEARDLLNRSMPINLGVASVQLEPGQTSVNLAPLMPSAASTVLPDEHWRYVFTYGYRPSNSQFTVQWGWTPLKIDGAVPPPTQPPSTDPVPTDPVIPETTDPPTTAPAPAAGTTSTPMLAETGPNPGPAIGASLAATFIGAAGIAFSRRRRQHA